MALRKVFLFWLMLGFLFLGSFGIMTAQSPEPISPEILSKLDPRLIKQFMGTNSIHDAVPISPGGAVR